MSGWTAVPGPGGPFAASAPPPDAAAMPGPVRHAYPLAERNHSLGTALRLLLRTLPYALIRFAVLLAVTVMTIIWLSVAIGGAAWLGARIAPAFGVVWFVLCLVVLGWGWFGLLRYGLHLIACGHVAVLTDLITKGQVGNGSESQFAYGRRVVISRIGQETVLFGLNAAVRGIVNTVHRSLDWVAQGLDVPGLTSLANLASSILRAATRYLDKVIFSYNLARGDEDPWRGAREGIVYYAQNAGPIVKTSIWVVILERLLSLVLWIALLVPAAAITVLLPHPVRAAGAIVTIVVAILLAACLRGAFLKPLFLIIIMVRFHALIENQPINAEWDARLASLTGNFAALGRVAGRAPA